MSEALAPTSNEVPAAGSTGSFGRPAVAGVPIAAPVAAQMSAIPRR